MDFVVDLAVIDLDSALRIETENAKVANFEFPPPQLIQATFSEGISEYGI